MDPFSSTVGSLTLIREIVSLTRQTQAARNKVEGASKTLNKTSEQLPQLESSLNLVLHLEPLRTAAIERQLHSILGIAIELKQVLEKPKSNRQQNCLRRFIHALKEGGKEDEALQELYDPLERARDMLCMRIQTARVGLVGNLRDGFSVVFNILTKTNTQVRQVLGIDLALMERLGPRAADRKDGMLPLDASDEKELGLNEQAARGDITAPQSEASFYDNITLDQARTMMGDVVEENWWRVAQRKVTISGNRFEEDASTKQDARIGMMGNIRGQAALDFDNNSWTATGATTNPAPNVPTKPPKRLNDFRDSEQEAASVHETPEDLERTRNEIPEPHLFPNTRLEHESWKEVRNDLPNSWLWDIDYQKIYTNAGEGKGSGCWTCTPTEPDGPKNLPLTISGAPVVIPVYHRWPPIVGVNPPPDPRPSAPLDCTAMLPLEVIRDLFLTFEGCIGFYILINGLLQIIVPSDFNTVWASSHLPHTYGGLRVCYIPRTVEPTVLPGKTEIAKSGPLVTAPTPTQTLKLNSFIEARTNSSKKDKFEGRIGMRLTNRGVPYLVMSTHVITEAILARSHRWLLGSDHMKKLRSHWNSHVEVWAGNERVACDLD
ncbi:hypothetical protein F5Y03DRAFT_343345 [Xylaria venustula]|nr:hypothetical protein F5Y03DRAFT_343345 [Xylaria venustula]